MPHSLRLQGGRLYVPNVGTGEVGWIDQRDGRFEPITFCPGFLHGLALVGNDALVGLSLPRQHRDVSGLPFDERLKQGALSRNARCR
ncbi:DUF4915 domain-containing protein [Azospirillum picis]|uniref:Uncharacterized protein (TIGR03032 family) n=1 Tax=Azospirillum picis TaxID=488438 RepID=A0ABU0MTZ7_9PROT|nr:DUF4915 domain-containing protein [Azospirillum picis]MBP2303230.1 uncharacterized protein (TIGR03032 family) [Azospirillum picis]MDQ0536963.1 uncharacterized protein (TIGR03032 family) [Azospirillum picis]